MNVTANKLKQYPCSYIFYVVFIIYFWTSLRRTLLYLVNSKWNILTRKYFVLLGLCAKHQCFCFFGPNLQCQEKIKEGHILCQNHACLSLGCGNVKTTGQNQEFCEEHACYVCLENNLVNVNRFCHIDGFSSPVYFLQPQLVQLCTVLKLENHN